MKTAHLEKWAVIEQPVEDGYQPPEMRKRALVGIVSNHHDPIFRDGDVIRASRIVSIDKDTQTVRTVNTTYTLGEVDPAYEALYPNARERLFNNSL